MVTFFKDPDAILDYHVDWGVWLTERDSIASSVWLTFSPDVSVVAESLDNNIASAVVSGGRLGMVYTLTNRVTTQVGLVQDKSIRLAIKEN